MERFLQEDDDAIIGALVTAVAKTGIESQRATQIAAWREEIRILKDQLHAHDLRRWHIALEYELPRRSKRPDVILLADDVIFVVEFKVGAKDHDASARWQAEDYCLNLRDFHAESRNRTLVPVVCASNASNAPEDDAPIGTGTAGVQHVIQTNRWHLGQHLIRAHAEHHRPDAPPIEACAWLTSPYRPTPTITEAAIRLYEHHGVRDLSHSHAYNLDRTTGMLTRIVRDAREHHRRVICFVTGVPGAGKTLTGLDVVHDPALRSHDAPAGIFLSGNGPLVKVVQEAIVMSQVRQGRRRQDCMHEVTTFIQNVHQFLRYHHEHPELAPHEHVVVFDEAQRAWDSAQMQRKWNVGVSEADVLLDVMERLPDWSVVIALVGGGQEIFSGEAGLEEWGRALERRGDRWEIVASPDVVEGAASVAGHRLFAHGIPEQVTIREEPDAHLAVSVRSHRAQRLAEWVNDLLTLNPERARHVLPDSREFPLFVTRDLDQARAWLRLRSGMDPDRRCGLVATSEDQRLRAHGLESSSAFRLDYPFQKWFLAPPSDCRSSYTLEVAASEFECQGLELDWVGVCWGGDLTPESDQVTWAYRKFRGANWQNVRQDVERAYVRNRYRVLLTRARQGMVIWVPPGAAHDPTRDPQRFDRLYQYLRSAGVPDLQENLQA
ncbi:hypothetical protein HNR42_002846 [Deinobacterium chartae]|uniref:Schlafen group 3-like DNA/RNA helicase domain-containing protein n=1 Tax=Deinobacterium chartae TaxID=521158 RepID=A0A841I6D4_9DEIO|nr:hypothetical protein [Deinobacterium chartae]